MLTDRQRWDIMRLMIKQKNEEYSSFLFRFFDSVQMKLVAATTRDNFLSQCKISGQNLVVGLEEHAKKNTKVAKTSWIDNLSSEDLLIFLDYRCRVLQQIYKHYRSYNNITKHDISYICANTLINKLAMYNRGRLTCGGRPEKLENELPINELGCDIYMLQRQAINQTADELMENCIRANLPFEQVYKSATELATYNVNHKGHVTGCMYNIKQSEFLERLFYKPSPKHHGFDIQGSPVYEHDNQYYSSSGNRINDDDIIFNSLEEEFTN